MAEIDVFVVVWVFASIFVERAVADGPSGVTACQVERSRGRPRGGRWRVARVPVATAHATARHSR